MEHFIGYHNADDWGPYFSDDRARQERRRTFFTAKKFRPETLIGNRAWAIEGSGLPRRYRIVSTGVISDITIEKRPAQYRQLDNEDGTLVHFDVDRVRDPIDVTDLAWFETLQQEQQHFRYGFSRITNEVVVAALNDIWFGSEPDIDAELLRQIDELRADPALGATTRKALIDARLGQGRFREGLQSRWKNACAVTGCAITAVLRASHIKPWRSSTNEERLDSANGLLLAAHLDALFDAGLISFGDDGRMLVSKLMPSKEARYFQIPAGLRDKLTAREKCFLAYHRAEVFKR